MKYWPNSYLCKQWGQYTWVLNLSCRKFSLLLSNTASSVDETFLPTCRLHRVAKLTSLFKSWAANTWFIMRRYTASSSALWFDSMNANITPFIAIGLSSTAQMILFGLVQRGFLYQPAHTRDACIGGFASWMGSRRIPHFFRGYFLKYHPAELPDRLETSPDKYRGSKVSVCLKEYFSPSTVTDWQFAVRTRRWK